MRGRDAVSRILKRYGRPVQLLSSNGESKMECRAFLQPIPISKLHGQQWLPTELGLQRQERFLYLGDAALPLEGTEGELILCDGVEYEIKSAQPVFLGDRINHWRAVLTRREEDGL